MAAFKKAQREQAKLKVLLTGPSGAGKTYSALAIASGMGKKIAVIDTENNSASLYADRFEFDVLAIQPPYTLSKHFEAVRAAVDEGYDIVIVDSISHAWAGDGGLLAKKEALDARGGNSFANWAGITKEHESFKSLIVNCPIHMICTARSKQEFVLEANEKGKQSPKRVGMAPIQRDGIEYEFTTVLDLGMDHSALASKDRTSMFDGQPFKPSKDTGKQFMAWLSSGAAAAPTPNDPKPETPAPAAMGPAPTPALTIAPPVQEGWLPVCPKCQARVIKKDPGYTCPNWAARNDGHLRFHASALSNYQKQTA